MGLFLPISTLFLVTFTLCSFASETDKQNLKIIKLTNKTQVSITYGQLTSEIKNKQLIYIGEKHDNPRHHEIQLKILRDLYKQNHKLAIGMEMFQTRFQGIVNSYIFGDLSESDFIDQTEYKKRWGYDYDLYRPIIDFAKLNKIPLITLNIESEVTKKISKHGISNLKAVWLNKLPLQIDFSNNSYRNDLYEIFKEHPKSSQRGFERFYSIQLVWDEFMAEQISNYKKSNPDYRVIVLAGNGHLAYSHGIPSRVYKRINEPYSVILNDAENKDGIADYIINSLNE
ncbi:MAG: hypothetical protein GWM89_06745 [Candidatus Dadabacteria bacterium]|nr:ChaN family lipoprotein [Candidatus Dadabacteria bacterium]NIY22109.1 hypothetical protein [Candidatus Dadabacteria bacterium]